MSYSGKTNWQFDEVVKEADLNRIEQGLLDAHARLEDITPEQIGAASKTEFDAHADDSGLHVTAQKQQEWDDKETTAGAQAKASQAETNTKNYVNELVWQKHRLTNDNGTSINISNGDANNLVYNGEFVGENVAHAPRTGAGEWFYFKVEAMARGVWVKQIAVNLFANTFQMRTGSDSGGGAISWGPWTDDLFTTVVNGKAMLATVIGAGLTSGHSFEEFRGHIQWCKNKLVHNLGINGVTANDGEALYVLADKVASIQTGRPYAEAVLKFEGGNDINAGTGLKATIPDFAFTPTLAFVVNIPISSVGGSNVGTTAYNTISTLASSNVVAPLGSNARLTLTITGNQLIAYSNRPTHVITSTWHCLFFGD